MTFYPEIRIYRSKLKIFNFNGINFENISGKQIKRNGRNMSIWTGRDEEFTDEMKKEQIKERRKERATI